MNPAHPQKLRILLILPQDNIYYYKGILRNSLGYAPLTLVTLAALVPQELDAEIEIIDEGVQKPDYKSKHYNVVAITCVASSSPRAYKLAAEFRGKGSHVVLGGAHPTLMPEEAGIHGDTVMVGPGEITWPQFLRDYSKGTPKKRYRHIWDQSPYQSMPIPRWDIQPKGLYMSVPTIIANRGCRNQCSFCTISHVYQSKSLCRPIEEVVNEIQTLNKRRFLFLDPSPTSDKAYAEQLFRALVPLRIKWMGLTTLDVVDDPPLLKLMAESGCTGVLVGFESFSQCNNDNSNKSFNDVKRYKEVITTLHGLRISVLGHFIIGFDGDTRESILEMLDIIDELGIDLPRFTILTPFPGTDLFRRMQEQGRIMTEDMSLYDTENVVFKPQNMEPHELKALYMQLKKEAYSFKRILRRSIQTSDNRILVFASNIGFRFMQNNHVVLALLTNLSLKIYMLIGNIRSGDKSLRSKSHLCEDASERVS